jgi:hypothetical protein
MNIIRLHSTLTEHYIHVQVDNDNMAQSPYFLLPLPIPSLHPFLLPFTYLETLLDVIGSRPPWSQVTHELTSLFSTPPHPSPFQIPSIPSHISPASRANKDDDSTLASKIRNMYLYGYDRELWFFILDDIG